MHLPTTLIHAPKPDHPKPSSTHQTCPVTTEKRERSSTGRTPATPSQQCKKQKPNHQGRGYLSPQDTHKSHARTPNEQLKQEILNRESKAKKHTATQCIDIIHPHNIHPPFLPFPSHLPHTLRPHRPHILTPNTPRILILFPPPSIRIPIVPSPNAVIQSATHQHPSLKEKFRYSAYCSSCTTSRLSSGRSS